MSSYEAALAAYQDGFPPGATFQQPSKSECVFFGEGVWLLANSCNILAVVDKEGNCHMLSDDWTKADLDGCRVLLARVRKIITKGEVE